MASPRPRRTIRRQLIYLVLVCVLPVWAVAGALVFHDYQAKRASIDQKLLETARTLRQMVDRELAIAKAAMTVLATSSALSAGDLAAFDRQARDTVKLYPGSDIILADVTGKQLVNTYKPFGAPLPKSNRLDIIRRVFETEMPFVSTINIPWFSPMRSRTG